MSHNLFMYFFIIYSILSVIHYLLPRGSCAKIALLTNKPFTQQSPDFLDTRLPTMFGVWVLMWISPSTSLQPQNESLYLASQKNNTTGALILHSTCLISTFHIMIIYLAYAKVHLQVFHCKPANCS